MKSRVQRRKTIITSLCMLFMFLGLIYPSMPSRAAYVSSASPKDPRPKQPADVTFHMSIPAAAFHPREKAYVFLNVGASLRHVDNPGGDSGYYYAALYLPNGATLVGMSFIYCNNWTVYPAGLTLYRTSHLDDSQVAVAETLTSALDCTGITSTTSFTYPTIDNIHYMYYLSFGVADSSSPYDMNVLLDGVTIAYTLPDFTPNEDYLSIPAAAFVPYSDDQNYINEGDWLYYFGGTGTADFQAPVFLPNGATALDATYYYFDSNASLDGQASLRRTDLADTWNPTMADFAPTGTPWWSSLSSSIINFASINNSSNGYWSFFRLPSASNVKGKSLLIHYNLGSGPNPMETISIPAAAFTPMTEAQDYENHGRYLKFFGGADGGYVAPVYAPHGAYLRRMIFYYNQIGATADRVELLTYEYAGYSGGTINTVYTSGTGYQSDSASLYNYKVDNVNERLYLELTLTANNSWPCGVVIEYSRYASLLFLPTVQKN